MKMIPKTVLTILFLVATHFPVFAQVKNKETEKSHLLQLQGKWEGVEAGRDASGKCTLTISGNAIHFEGASKTEWYKATFTVELDTDPKQLHAIIKECSVPDVVGKSAHAIYKIENGTVTLVGHPPGAPAAPKSFEGDDTSRSFTFKKVKTAKPEGVETK